MQSGLAAPGGLVTVRDPLGPLALRLPNTVDFRGDGVQARALLAAALGQRDVLGPDAGLGKEVDQAICRPADRLIR